MGLRQKIAEYYQQHDPAFWGQIAAVRGTPIQDEVLDRHAALVTYFLQQGAIGGIWLSFETIDTLRVLVSDLEVTAALEILDELSLRSLDEESDDGTSK